MIPALWTLFRPLNGVFHKGLAKLYRRNLGDQGQNSSKRTPKGKDLQRQSTRARAVQIMNTTMGKSSRMEVFLWMRWEGDV